MILDVHRDEWGDDWTLSTWSVDGVPECYGIEDTDRKLEANPNGKIPGRTAIPRGRYKLIISFSPRFKRDLPLLIGVPGFAGVRIHPGNSSADTDGCLLPGSAREPGRVGNSRMAFERLMAKIAKAYGDGEEIAVDVS